MAIGGAYLNIVMFAEPEKNASGVGQVGEIDQVASELTGVPIVVGGKVVGYLVFRLKMQLFWHTQLRPRSELQVIARQMTLTGTRA